MKKNFIILGLFLSLTAFSQSSKFSKFNSIAQLRSEYKNVSEKDKGEYYVKYLKLREVEELKQNREFKKFSDKILIQLANEMYDDKPYNEDLKGEDKLKYQDIFEKVEKANKEGKKVNIDDLLFLYNPSGIYSGLQIADLFVKNNSITFAKTTGTTSGTYYYSYKVKGDKLIKIKK